jgi:hypothetical protein
MGEGSGQSFNPPGDRRGRRGGAATDPTATSAPPRIQPLPTRLAEAPPSDLRAARQRVRSTAICVTSAREWCRLEGLCVAPSSREKKRAAICVTSAREWCRLEGLCVAPSSREKKRAASAPPADVRRHAGRRRGPPL